MTTEITTRARPCGAGRTASDPEPATGARSGLSVPPRASARWRMPVMPMPARSRRRGGAGAVVGDLDGRRTALVAQSHRRLRRPGVARHVGQGFLHDPERGQLDLGRQADRQRLPIQLDVEAGGPDGAHQRVEVRQRGRGRTGRALAAAEDVERGPQLLQGVPARLLDGGQGGRACSGCSSSRCRATPAWTLMREMSWASTSWSSWASASRCRVPSPLLVLLLRPGPLGGVRPADAHQLRDGQHPDQPAGHQGQVHGPWSGSARGSSQDATA